MKWFEHGGYLETKLNPLFVKDFASEMSSLRIRTLFVVVPLVSVLLCLMTTTGDNTSPGSPSDLCGIIIFLSVFVLPSSMRGTMQAEREKGTLDLLNLTGLSAFRIVFGKWLAVTFGGLLVSFLFLPLLVYEHLQGKSDLLLSLWSVGLSMLIFSTVTSLIAFGSSSREEVSQNRMSGWFALILMILGFWMAQAIYSLFSGSGFSYAWKEDGFLPALIIVGVAANACFLELAASRIASESENHALRKRLLTVVSMLVLYPLAAISSQGIAILVLLAVTFLVLVNAIVAVCEDEQIFANMVKPFIAKGRLGRIAGRILYPGATSGVFFALLILPVSYALTLVSLLFSGIDITAISGRLLAIMAGLMGLVFLPTVVSAILPKRITKIKNALMQYVGIHAVMLVIILVSLIVVGEVYNYSSNSNELLIVTILHPITTIVYAIDKGSNSTAVVITSALQLGFYTLVPLFIASRRLAPIREVERRAELEQQRGKIESAENQLQ
ncbi:MAG: hypothetical protein PHC51_08800 [bacterium]|nr:hypothetical protein [bacterium]